MDCLGNSGCPGDKICEKNKCINPCSAQCAVNAECSVKNHITTCKCPQGSDGDPFTSCDKKNTQPGTGGTQGSGGTTDYCNPTPCGANSNCRAENGRAVCSCRVGFIGNPIEVTNKKKINISFSFRLIHILILKMYRDAEGSASLTLTVVHNVLVLHSVAKILAFPAALMPNAEFK